MKITTLKTGFAATRSRLGLSQRQLAELLGVSKAAIGMAEIGHRNLSVPALLKLAELEIKTAAARIPATLNSEMERSMELPLTDRCTSIQIRELQCELKVQKLTDKLEKMITQYKNLDTQLRLLNEMFAKEPDRPDNITALWLQVHREVLRNQLSKCSLMEQTLLRNKIALLSAETNLNKSVRQSIVGS